MMNLSIIIPSFNESESLNELHQWISKVVKRMNIFYEIIFIDDGSNDESWSKIKKITKKDNQTLAVRFSRNFGKSQALHAGFSLSKGEVIITLDADLQDSPDEIPNLYNRIISEKLDIISGWKKRRYDSLIFKNIPSKISNFAARKASGINLNDFNSGLKAYRKEVVKSIELYGEMHRYIPLLAANKGFNRIGEQIVKHQKRKFGYSKFGFSRFINGLLDLITLIFLKKFGRRPMHFFGLWGLVLVFIGLFFSVYIGFDKLFLNKDSRMIAQRPEFYIALATMILGGQLFVAGFLGELINGRHKNSNQYSISESINVDENSR